MPSPSVHDDMFDSVAFNGGAGSGLGKSTLHCSFGSLGGVGLDHDSVPGYHGPQFGAGTVS